MENQTELTERGIRQANLSRGSLKLELIELSSSVDPHKALESYPERSRLQGIFKIGFTVRSFEKWITHFKSHNVAFNGDVVSDPHTGKKMVIIKDPDGNRIQFFEK